jgi:hypothetical protein
VVEHRLHYIVDQIPKLHVVTSTGIVKISPNDGGYLPPTELLPLRNFTTLCSSAVDWPRIHFVTNSAAGDNLRSYSYVTKIVTDTRITNGLAPVLVMTGELLHRRMRRR